MKDEDSTKVKIETKIDFTILDNENLQIVTSHQGAFNDIVAAHQVEVMRLKDEGIKNALVKLGWTPPGVAPRIHEDNARTLQEIIDDLRIILGAADGERITDAARRAATKRPAQATQVEVTDAEIDALCLSLTGFMTRKERDRAVARAILALRPVRVPMTGEQWTDVLGSAGADMLDLAKQWADNKIHVYQVVNEAEKIVKAAVLRGITAQAKKETP